MEGNISSMPDKTDLIILEEPNQLQGTKRKADIHLAKQHGVKRFALGNLTNAESENLLTQKPQKASAPVSKTKPSDASKTVKSNNRGVSKIITRATIRLEKALSNVKKHPEDHRKQENVMRNQSNQSSSCVIDFAEVNVSVGVEKKPELSVDTKGNGGNENTKLCTSKVHHQKPYLAAFLQNGEKSCKTLEDVDLKKRGGGRFSNDFEMSDNSLYVSAIESSDEDNNSSTVDATKKQTSEKEGRTAVLLIESELSLLQAKNYNMAEKSAETKASVEEKPLTLDKLTSSVNLKSFVRGGTNNTEEHFIIGEMIDRKLKKQISSEFELSNDTLYVSAIDSLEEETSSCSGQTSMVPLVDKIKTTHSPRHMVAKAGENEQVHGISEFSMPCYNTTDTKHIEAAGYNTGQPKSPPKRTPLGVEDFDKTYWNDVNQVSEYAQDIFKYLRDRESAYVIKDYMALQPQLSHYMRALLIDWMVEIQESFELNHETLYLAVKIVDTYLSRVTIGRDTLQLVAAASLLIASKYDERVPPTVDDFIYICDGAYERPDLLKMERTVFRTIGFDLGFPLSYRFLRRYARVSRIPMPILTLARYILETSLMDYTTVILADSKLACASLFIALRMFNQSGWNRALEFYSGYKLGDFKDIVILLNNGIRPRKPSPFYKLNNVREKYSHELFFQVAKRPIITTMEKLFNTTDELFKAPDAIGAPSVAQHPKTNDTESFESK